MLETFKVVWVDEDSEIRSRTFAIDERVSDEQLREAARDVATNSRFGLDAILRIVPCHPGGAIKELT